MLVYHVWVFSTPDADRVEAGWATALLPDLAFGVTLFFALSGFLLYRPFAAALIRGGPRPAIRSYLRNRFLRIAPAYVVILLVSSIVMRSVFVRGPGGELGVGGAESLGWLASNLSLTQNYTPSGVITGIAPAWSLAVEVVFYLSLPLLVVAVTVPARVARSSAARRAISLLPAGVLLVVGLAGKLAAAAAWSGDGWGADWGSVVERSFVCHADLFAFGMALAVLSVVVRDRGLGISGGWRLITAAAALLLYSATTLGMDRWGQLGTSPLNTVTALACTLLLALVVVPERGGAPSRVARMLERRPFVLVGLVSYSIFLWHVPVIFFLREHGLTLPGAFGLGVNLVTVAGLTLALSTLTYRLVEAPALRRKSPMVTGSPPRGSIRAGGLQQVGPEP